ncbi:MAG: restriction endonuclease [Anaerolineae bacterium]|nr:restriction endonuclease [Anaerolineae bacterium]
MSQEDVNNQLESIFKRYQQSFSDKIYAETNHDSDILMSVFGITPTIKQENRQYWGRELGMCWQLIVTAIFRHHHAGFGNALKLGDDEPCDFVFDKFAVDTKYRIGSGDSGTLKKFKQYGHQLREQGFEPTLLILRTDNLPSAITACHAGTWQVYIGGEAFTFIKTHTQFDLLAYLTQKVGDYKVDR